MHNFTEPTLICGYCNAARNPDQTCGCLMATTIRTARGFELQQAHATERQLGLEAETKRKAAQGWRR